MHELRREGQSLAARTAPRHRQLTAHGVPSAGDRARVRLHRRARKAAVPSRARAGKRFSQCRPDGKRMDWNLNGMRRVLYRLPEVLSAPPEQALFVVEGEKDADRLWAEGLPATTNSQGAGNGTTSTASRSAAERSSSSRTTTSPAAGTPKQVARSLHGVAVEVRIVDLPDLPEKGDVSDWLDAGHCVAELRAPRSDDP